MLNGWITDKIRLDIDEDIFNYVDVDEIHKFESNEKEIERLRSALNDDDDQQQTVDILAIKGVDYDKYDEEYLTKDIMNRIMKKRVVDAKKLMANDDDLLGNNGKSNRTTRFVDTKLKIELRHQAVKENREKRRREIEEKRRERVEKKEIEMKAKLMVLKEENDKKMREEIEKQLIEQEAQKLRLEMAEKRYREEEMRKKYNSRFFDSRFFYFVCIIHPNIG